jgi:hypothetical protein
MVDARSHFRFFNCGACRFRFADRTFGGSYESVVRPSHAFVGCYFRAPALFLPASTPTNRTRSGQSEDGKIRIEGQLEAVGAWFGASVAISMKPDSTYISVRANPTVRTRIAEPTTPHARAISLRAYTLKEFIGGAEDSMVLVPIGIAFYSGTFGLDLTFGWLMDKGDHGTELTGGISTTF